MAKKTEGFSCCGPVKETVEEKNIKGLVKDHYAGLVKEEALPCCGTETKVEQIAKGKIAQRIGYSEEELRSLPQDAVDHSFGCGNPLAFAEVREGQTVLDLGCGAGIDVLLAARKVGASGKVIGLDMTPEMIEKAEENAHKVGATNVEFRLGEMEEMPVEDSTIDWIISNCVINLSPDKRKVFSEAFRVLKPGGRLSVSDIVVRDLPEPLLRSFYAYVSCIAGALEEDSYLDTIRAAGLTEIEIVNRVDYDSTAIASFMKELGDQMPRETKELFDKCKDDINGKIFSIKVTAKKP